MSAIAAVLRRDGSPAGEGHLRGLEAALRRRGPDGIGSWSGGPVGLLRFATETGAGAPGPCRIAEDPAADLRLAFDGRLDDREGIRRDLAQAGREAPDGSDADLALRAFAAFGPEGGAARLVGDFAFLLWDGRRRALVAGRDPLGIRPLLFHDDGRRVAFATEAAALIDGAGVPFAPDEGVAAEVLAGGPFSRAETLVRGIRRVLPGTLLTVTADGIGEREFRRIDPCRVRLPADDGGCVEAFRAVLREAIRCRLRSSTPAALLLSGGLDSGAVAAFAADLLRGPSPPGPGLRAFTVSFPGLPCDEADAARATAAATGIPHEVIPWEPPAAAWFAEDAREGRDLPGLPVIPGSACVAARIRAAGLRVVLDGEGGDEILRASPWLAADLLGEGRFAGAWREARWWGGARALVEFGVRPFLPGAVRRAVRLLRPTDPLPPWVDRGLARRVGLLDRVRSAPPSRGPAGFARSEVAADLVAGHALAGREAADRWGTRCGAEPRHPLLDLRVVETALALPHRLRSTESGDRTALRRAQEGLLPEGLLCRREKAEFTPAVLAALRVSGFLDRPRAPLLEEAGWVDLAALAAAARDIEARVGRGEPGAHADSAGAWNTFALETWLREARGPAREIGAAAGKPG